VVEARPHDARGSRTVSTASIEVKNNAVRLALGNVASHHGFRPISNGAMATCRIADDCRDPGDAVDVLVVEALPVRAAMALEAMRTGAARTIILADDPEGLAFAIEGLSKGVATIPAVLIELAGCIPPLTPRQHELLSALVDGHDKVAVIADRLGQSLATIKRDLVRLYESFGVGGRHELAEVARSLGYPAHRRPRRRWQELQPGVVHAGRPRGSTHQPESS
jgi:DNA-binding NarL/FixJ family response regulator